MASTGAPEVILRYDHEQDRDQFTELFARDFTVRPFATDAAALAFLTQASNAPAAIIILPRHPNEHVDSPLLAEARDRHPRLLKILLGETIALNLLVSMLDTQLIDRCFEQPANPDLIRSHILTAALTPTATPPSRPAQTVAGDCKPAVLIVDDEPTATRYLARQLERLQEEFRVLCAVNAHDALLRIREEGDSIAVVMTDQRMPGVQGKELLDELRQSHPAIVRILTSAWGEVDVALDAVNEGRIFRYQKKPWQAGDLLTLFRKALNHHHALVAARDSSRCEAERHFAELRQQRHARLIEALSAPLEQVIHGPVMADFLDALARIRTLPANASHLRASRETPLEQELVRGFADTVRQQLAHLTMPPNRGPLHPSELESALADMATGDALASEGDQPPLAMLCRSLATLLAASGLDHRHLVLDRADGSLRLETPAPLKMYSHLLAPLTRLSRPLLEQQTALLMLHLTSRLLAGELTLEGGEQSYWVTLQFSATASRWG